MRFIICEIYALHRKLLTGRTHICHIICDISLYPHAQRAMFTLINFLLRRDDFTRAYLQLFDPLLAMACHHHCHAVPRMSRRCPSLARNQSSEMKDRQTERGKQRRANERERDGRVGRSDGRRKRRRQKKRQRTIEYDVDDATLPYVCGRTTYRRPTLHVVDTRLPTVTSKAVGLATRRCVCRTRIRPSLEVQWPK